MTTTPKSFGKYQVRHEIGKGSMGWTMCSARARGGCVVVSCNGDYRPAAMNEIANRLGTLAQARVREGFLRSVGREFP